MVIDLLGILEDGSPRSPLLPPFAQKQVNIVAASSATFRISVVCADGTPVALAEDPALILTLAVSESSYMSPLPNLKKQAVLTPLAGINTATFSLSPGDTKFAPPGRYVYAVWMTYRNERNAVIPVSPFVIGPAGLLS